MKASPFQNYLQSTVKLKHGTNLCVALLSTFGKCLSSTSWREGWLVIVVVVAAQLGVGAIFVCRVIPRSFVGGCGLVAAGQGGANHRTAVTEPRVHNAGQCGRLLFDCNVWTLPVHCQQTGHAFSWNRKWCMLYVIESVCCGVQLFIYLTKRPFENVKRREASSASILRLLTRFPSRSTPHLWQTLVLPGSWEGESKTWIWHRIVSLT